RSVWWTWTAPTNGTVALDTIGSSFDTLLAVYTGNSVSSLSLISSDDNGGGGLTSRAFFDATQGTTYQIGVDGFNPSGIHGAAYGTIQLNLQESAQYAPTFVVQPISQAVVAGGAVLFSATVVGTPPPALQWLFNGNAILGKTNATLQ